MSGFKVIFPTTTDRITSFNESYFSTGQLAENSPTNPAPTFLKPNTQNLLFSREITNLIKKQKTMCSNRSIGLHVGDEGAKK